MSRGSCTVVTDGGPGIGTMDSDELKRRLGALDPLALVDFVMGLYGDSKELDWRIEAIALRDDPRAMGKRIGRRIRGLKSGRSFIPYRESFAFARSLEGILDDLQQLVNSGGAEARKGNSGPTSTSALAWARKIVE